MHRLHASRRGPGRAPPPAEPLGGLRGLWGRPYVDLTRYVNAAHSTGFNARWGGGRFQMRYLDLSNGDIAAPSGWETYSAVLSEGQIDFHPAFGTGREPAGIQQFKAHMTFFEANTVDMGDIDLMVEDNNCLPGAVFYGTDASHDIKSTVRVDSAAAGKAMCTALYAYSTWISRPHCAVDGWPRHREHETA
jgi:hypothetical protein